MGKFGIFGYINIPDGKFNNENSDKLNKKTYIHNAYPYETK